MRSTVLPGSEPTHVSRLLVRLAAGARPLNSLLFTHDVGDMLFWLTMLHYVALALLVLGLVLGVLGGVGLLVLLALLVLVLPAAAALATYTGLALLRVDAPSAYGSAPTTPAAP